MESTAASMQMLFELHTRLFENCLSEITEAMWTKRAETEANNLVEIGCHLLGARYYMTQLLGWEIPCPLAESLMQVKGVKGIGALPSLPTRGEVIDAWKRLADAALPYFDKLTQDLLQGEVDLPFPVSRKNRGGGALFLISHESYHIGQMAYLRRVFGLPAMSYT